MSNSSSINQIYSNLIIRCNTPLEDLDKINVQCQTQETTEFLITCFDPGILWTDFGIRSDVIVHASRPDLHFHMCFNLQVSQPFTCSFPHADIHKLLSPNLLHQLIKGTFKDHIVSWIQDYLNIMHGESWANKIIKDIDCW